MNSIAQKYTLCSSYHGVLKTPILLVAYARGRRGRMAPSSNQEGRQKWGWWRQNGVDKGVSGISQLLRAAKLQSPCSSGNRWMVFWLRRAKVLG